jgi:hypothetical protein
VFYYKYLTKGQNMLLSSYYSIILLVVCTYELTVLSYKQWFFIYIYNQSHKHDV